MKAHDWLYPDIFDLLPTLSELVSKSKNNDLGIELNQEYYNAVLEKFVKPGGKIMVFKTEQD